MNARHVRLGCPAILLAMIFGTGVARGQTQLTVDQCVQTNGVPRWFYFIEERLAWGVVGVNPAAGDTKSISVHSNMADPPLKSSELPSGDRTHFVLGDFHSMMGGRLYAKVYGGSVSPNYVAEYNEGPMLLDGVTYTGTVGGTGSDCNAVQTYEIELRYQEAVGFTFSSWGDVHMAFFRSDPMTPWRSRSDADFDLTTGYQEYVATTDGVACVVVYNDRPGSLAGGYTLSATRCAPLANRVCLHDQDGYKSFRVTQGTAGWAAMAVAPTYPDFKTLSPTDQCGTAPVLTCSGMTSGFTNLLVKRFTAPGAASIRAAGGATDRAYTVEYEGTVDNLPLGTLVTGDVGGSGPDCGLVRIWDVTLQAGHRYYVQLRRTSGAAEIGAMLFSPAITGWQCMGSAVLFAAWDGVTQAYDAPASGVYGLAVAQMVTDSGPGAYDLSIREGCQELTDGTCAYASSWLGWYDFEQATSGWGVVGVNRTGAADPVRTLLVTDDCGTGHYKAVSATTNPTNFIVADFNRHQWGNYFPRTATVNQQNYPYNIEWEGGYDSMPIGTPVTRSVGGTGAGCNLVEAWDLWMNASSTYKFDFSLLSGSANMKLALFSPADSSWAPREESVFETSIGVSTYTAPSSGVYGLVVFNDSAGNPPAQYRLRIDETCTVIMGGACESRTENPHWRLLGQNGTGTWWAAAVNPDGDTINPDIEVYSECEGGVRRASSSVPAGLTDFIVGPHSIPMLYNYAKVSNASAYTLEYVDGEGPIPFNTDVHRTVGGSSGSCGLIDIWDFQATPGKTYGVYLGESGSTSMRVASFAPGWSGRAGALFEKASYETPFYFSTVASGTFGLAVFNDAPGIGGLSGDYDLWVTESDPLIAGACASFHGVPRLFNFGQAQPRWAGVAVNPSGSDNKDLEVYRPQGGMILEARSVSTSGTDFVVGDFHSIPTGTYYARAMNGSGTADYVMLHNSQGALTPGSWTSWINVGGTSGSCNLINVWDVQLSASQAYTFTLEKSGTADTRVALFQNMGGYYWAGRAEARFEKSAAETPWYFVAPQAGWYGLVVFNNSAGSAAGSFRVRFDADGSGCNGLANGYCEQGYGLTSWFGFNQSASCWSVIAVGEATGDTRDLGIHTICGGGASDSMLAHSGVASGTDLIVGDFNHRTRGLYYPRTAGSFMNFIIEQDGDRSPLAVPASISGSVGGVDSTCGLADIWDLNLTAGRTYKFTLRRTGGTADIRTALFRSYANHRWLARQEAILQVSATGVGFWPATVTDIYGLVVFNNSKDSASGSYTLTVETLATTDIETPAAAGTWPELQMANPFTAGSRIQLRLPHDAATRVDLFDVTGRRLRTLCDALLSSGDHSIPWDGESEGGVSLHVGVYWIRATIGDFRIERKITLIN
jgi:hypothetical protein